MGSFSSVRMDILSWRDGTSDMCLVDPIALRRV